MGATYTRQSSSGITDGAVIEASDLNNEFDQLLAAFVAASGHTHDGTAAEGGPVTKLLGTAITIGDATAGTDISMTFDGESNDGVITWMEDEDLFKFSDAINVGVNDTGYDVKFFGATSGSYWLWDESADGVTQIGTLTVGVNDAGHDVKFFGDTASAYMLWDTSADDLVLAGSAGIDLAGDIDVDGTANLDAVDIDGAVQLDSTLTVGANDQGYDIKFFGDTASAYMLWDTSADDLVFAGSAGIDLAGDIDVDGTANLDNTDIDGTLAVDGTTISLDATTSLNIDNSNTSNGITIATATSGVPISIGHSTSETTVNDNLTVTGDMSVGGNFDVTGTIDLSDSDFTNAGDIQLDSITGDGDTNTSITFSGSDVITITAGGATQITFNDGSILPTTDNDIDLGSASYQFKDAYINGTLEADAITIGGTAIGSIYGAIAGSSSILTTGALDSGSITSGFGAIDNGTSGIRTNTFTAETSIIPDASGGADLGSASAEWGDFYIADDKYINFGSDQNILIGYDETTTDSLKIAATEGAGLAITLMADEGDDAGDEWKLNIADGGTITLGNDIASAGSYVTHLTLTPNSTVTSSNLSLAGSLTLGSVAAAGSDTDKFLVLDGSGNVDYRTGTQVASDIGASTAITALNNATANELITVGSTTTELDAEANLTFDGTDVLLGGAGKLQLRDTGLYVASNADGDLDVVSDGTAVDSINLESGGGITLDAGTASSGIIYEDDGTEMLRIHNSSSDVIVEAKVQDKDIIFKGDDGGAGVTALTLDMSAGGIATFSAAANVAQAALTSSSNAVAWDASAKPNAYHLTTENTTISAPTNAVEGAFICLEINHDGTTTVGWNTIFEFAASTEPTTTDTNAKTDIFVFRYNGAIWQEVGRTLNLSES